MKEVIVVTVEVTGGTEADRGTLAEDVETAVVASLMHQEPEDPNMIAEWRVTRRSESGHPWGDDEPRSIGENVR